MKVFWLDTKDRSDRTMLFVLISVVFVLVFSLWAFCEATGQHVAGEVGEGSGFVHAMHELWHSIVPTLGGILAVGIGGFLFHKHRKDK